jgi:hypothetical protein
MSKNRLVLLLVALIISGCQSTFGPGALEKTHPAYNKSISETLSEQMLINLVRLRYREQPAFLEIGSVTVSPKISTSANVDTTINLDSGGDFIQPGVGVEYSQSPTISYTPLRGEDFLKSVLSSISLEAILVMTQSGWSIERVFGMTIERMNGLYNAPSASGPTPALEPKRYENFARALEIFRHLQREGIMEIGPNIEIDKKQPELVMQFLPSKVDQVKSEGQELSSLLGTTAVDHKVIISSDFLNKQPNVLGLRVRSIMSVLFYLSQNIKVPDEHKEAGLVTVTKTVSGGEFNWSDTPAGKHFVVQSSKERPENAYISVPHRDYWFYIANNDLETKSSFLLLQQLFSLQAGQSEAKGPTLTLPVGGR